MGVYVPIIVALRYIVYNGCVSYIYTVCHTVWASWEVGQELGYVVAA